MSGVSVVAPILNEVDHLAVCVERVFAQDYPGPIELVLALGPSTDGTTDLAHRLAAEDPRIRLVDSPTGRTPVGLNLALGVSQYPVVVRVDGHAMIAPNYVRRALELLEESEAAVVGGWMHARGSSSFTGAVAWAMTSPVGVGSARHHTNGPAGPAQTVYLGVFRRDVLDQLGGFDESFTRAQDWELNFRIWRAGHQVWFSPALEVGYHPRSSLRALGRQYFDYGRWRRQVVREHSSVSVRYLAAPAALLAVAGGTALGLAGVRVGWLAPAGYAAGLVAAALSSGLTPRQKLLLPSVLATMHMAWGAGFLTDVVRPAR